MTQETTEEVVTKDKRGRKKGELVGAKYNVVPKKAVSAYLPTKTANALRDMALSLGRTRSSIVNEFIKNSAGPDNPMFKDGFRTRMFDELIEMTEKPKSVSINLHEICYDIISEISEDVNIPFASILRAIIVGNMMHFEEEEGSKAMYWL